MWNSFGQTFSFQENGNTIQSLPKGVYTLEYGPFGSMYLRMSKESFDFSYKIYGHDGFPERVVKAFQVSSGNLGVMLAGLKGTGKTVQAEQIANLCEMPVILVSKEFDEGKDLVKFLSIVDQPVCVMIDEYEKLFGDKDCLLSVMDGAMSGSQRRLFVLTANELSIANALLDRPSRILYLKKFGNLDVKVVQEVVDDMLQHTEYRDEVVEYLSTLEILTIDIVKTVVKEVNVFNEPPSAFKKFLNVTVRLAGRWDVVDENGKLVVSYGISSCKDPLREGTYLHFAGGDEDLGIELGYVRSCDKKTGKVTTTDDRVYFVKKAEVTRFLF